MTEFQLLDISFITRWSYHINTHTSRTCSHKSAVKLNIPFMVQRLVGSWKPVLQYMQCRVSPILPGTMWRQTSHVAVDWACSYRPRQPISYTICRQLAAVQRTRQLAGIRLRGDGSGIVV